MPKNAVIYRHVYLLLITRQRQNLHKYQMCRMSVSVCVSFFEGRREKAIANDDKQNSVLLMYRPILLANANSKMIGKIFIVPRIMSEKSCFGNQVRCQEARSNGPRKSWPKFGPKGMTLQSSAAFRAFCMRNSIVISIKTNAPKSRLLKM